MKDDTIKSQSLRKVLVSNGMESNKILFLTDAPKDVLEEWCHNCNDAIENGNAYSLEMLKPLWYVKILADSDVDDYDDEDIKTIGYDEEYDLSMYYENHSFTKEELEKAKTLAYKNGEKETTNIGFLYLDEVWITNPFTEETGRFEFTSLNEMCNHYGKDNVYAFLGKLLAQ